ncbi:type II toxin-antitoxin system RelE/ParE family toxin [Lentilactobacillus diolivorans]|uniref:type II toxin-antitoxin system RelE/ParE family toxin n=1 Tax=Lentilactobacillus diolivorans TaxID=179838 RepID=UPI002468873B|nr:type II toxin-antitoxin system RelE/ParE family toxin [Lentilactobacillus diolivorans]MDH5105809.1 type II toxin-antitoxin system RelE/ParE family toxin [Lentilactobacillus diolivorans]
MEAVEAHGLAISSKKQWTKSLGKGLFEIRVHLTSTIDRSIYFRYTSGKYVITQSFIKKTQKTPKQEIKKANYRRRTYYDEQNHRHDQ